MSAWIVDKEHIDYLLHAAMTDRYGIKYGGITVETMTADAIGRELWRENMLSVAYRYRDSQHLDTLTGLPGPCEFDHESLATYTCPVFPRLRFDPVVALKAIACYEYQSCEHPGWRDSAAQAFCDDLRGSLIHRLPGYDDAPWGIDAGTGLARRDAVREVAP